MSFVDLPDVALIKIFRTLDLFELVRLYQDFHSHRRIQNLILNSSCLWTNIHIQLTVDYYLFEDLIDLIKYHCSTIRELTIDQLDLTCRKILLDRKFSLKKFTQLQLLIIHDDILSKSLSSIDFCLKTLKILRLTNEHTNLQPINHFNQLNEFQTILYSNEQFSNQFPRLINLHLKIMFDHDHQSQDIFFRLPNESLRILTLKFLILNPDLNFSNELTNYLDTCFHLHTLELFYLHGMCPVTIHSNLNYSQYQRLIFVNICQLKQMRTFFELNQIDLPNEYLQMNSIFNSNQYSSYIQKQIWFRREVISIDYLQCITTSMNLFNQMTIIWSDKNQMTQSFESYILRSIYNISSIIKSIENLSINKFELSLNGLIILMTNLPLVKDFILTNGSIDQMGAGMLDIEKMIQATRSISPSNIEKIFMNNVSCSRRTLVHICLITEKLTSLIMNDVKIFDKNQTYPNVLNLLKQIAQTTNLFKWNQLKSLTFGKNLLNSRNLCSFIPSHRNHTYAPNLTHLCFIIHNHSIFADHDLFLKSMRKFIENFPSLTSFILEFTHRYEGEYRLRNQLLFVFERYFNRKVTVYPTKFDRACRFCFHTNISDDSDSEENFTNQSYRTFCGIPLFQTKNQRKSNLFFCI